ncbi:MAG: hypothetical protein AAFQ52_06460 [Chloroflexota bacterium]
MTSRVLAEGGVDLSVTMASSDAIVPADNNITYTLTINNLGIETATFVTATDSLPTGFTFISSPDACIVIESTVTCTVGDLVADTSVVVSYIVRASSIGVAVSNAVSVSSAETDSDSTNNVASVTVTIVEPEPTDLALLVSASQTTLEMSDETELTLTVMNTSNTSSYMTRLMLTLPPQLSFVSSTHCAVTAIAIVCEVGTVTHLSSESVTLMLRAIAPGDAVTIAGTVSHAGTDPNVANDAAGQTITINDPPPDSADLALSISASANQYTVGSNMVLTYTVINRGPGAASQVQITDPLVADLRFISSPDCTLSTNEITCDVGVLALNDIYVGSVTVTAMVTTPALPNAASVTGTEFDPNLYNNVQTLVLPSSSIATSTPTVVTAIATSRVTAIATSPPPVQVVSTQVAVATNPSVGQGGHATQNSDGNNDTVISPSQAVSSNSENVSEVIAPSDLYGWTRYESVDLIQVTGTWHLRTIANASDTGYHESRDSGASLRYPFEGEGIRIGYRSEVHGATLQIHLDGVLWASIETDVTDIDPTPDPVRQTLVTPVYWLTPGYHLLDLSCLAEGQGSGGCNIDYVEVFTGPPVPAPAESIGEADLTDEFIIIVNDVELVSAPPTLAPSATPAPASIITVDVIVSIDLNANGQVDANEGIDGITVRAVAVSDNALLVTTRTDSAGFVRVTVATTRDVVLLIPILGESFYVRNRGSTEAEAWHLLLEPVNVPGLIP